MFFLINETIFSSTSLSVYFHMTLARFKEKVNSFVNDGWSSNHSCVSWFWSCTFNYAYAGLIEFFVITFPPVGMNFFIKLDRTNFLVYCKQLLTMISTAFGTENYTDATLLTPTPVTFGSGGINVEFEVWTRMNGTIKSWL